MNKIFFSLSIRFHYLKAILLFAIVLFNTSLHAQDTVVTRADEKIVAKILEVNPNNIKYKRLDYLDGPTFTTLKWELKYIVYSNGVIEHFETVLPPVTEKSVAKDLFIQTTGKYYYYKGQRIAEQDMLDIAWKVKDKNVNLFIRKTEEKKSIKNVCLIGGLGLTAAGILTYTGVLSAYNTRANASTFGRGRGARAAQNAARLRRQRTGGYLVLGGLGCELLSLTFNIQEIRSAHMVVDLYNKSLSNEPVLK